MQWRGGVSFELRIKHHYSGAGDTKGAEKQIVHNYIDVNCTLLKRMKGDETREKGENLRERERDLFI